MIATNHDYGNCLVGNFYSRDCDGRFDSWDDFKNTWLGFGTNAYDDTYHFIFRFDVHNQTTDGNYYLELCAMLQRKGIYCHIYVDNISQSELDTEVKTWLEGRKQYLDSLWEEI